MIMKAPTSCGQNGRRPSAYAYLQRVDTAPPSLQGEDEWPWWKRSRAGLLVYGWHSFARHLCDVPRV